MTALKKLGISGLTPKGIKETLLDFPLFIITNPFKGFNEMKNENRGKMSYAIVLLIVYGILKLFIEADTGFVISEYYTANPIIFVPYTLIMAYAPMVLFVIANWSVTTITEGKGKMKHIFLAYAYSMYPAVICSFIGLLLSHYVTLDEKAFAQFFFTFSIVANYFYLFVGLIVCHEYTFLKAVVTVLLTILAMLIIIFILALFVSLFGEVVTFFFTVYMETFSRF